MSAKIRFLYNDLIRNTTSANLSASTEATGFLVKNVRNEQKVKRWRSTDLTDETVAINLSVATSINCVALINHNLGGFSSVAPTVTLEGDDAATFDSDGGSPQFTTALAVVSGIIVKYFSATTARQYWRIKITGGTGGDAYYTIGRWMIGTYLQPTRAISLGSYNRSIIDFGTSTMSIGGQSHSNKQDLYRNINFSFDHATIADVDALDAMFEDVHTSNNVLVTTDSTDTTSINRTTFYGKFTGLPSWKSVMKTATADLYSSGVGFRESL